MMTQKEFTEKWVRYAASLLMTPEQAKPVLEAVNEMSSLNDKQLELMEGLILFEQINNRKQGLTIETPVDGDWGITREEMSQCKVLAGKMAVFDEKQIKLYDYFARMSQGRA